MGERKAINLSSHNTASAALVLHGYMDLPLDTRNVTTSVHYRGSEYGQIPGMTLALGDNADGPVRVRCEDAAYFRRLEAAARDCASFLEGEQRSGVAA